jgi:hypothetical protein
MDLKGSRDEHWNDGDHSSVLFAVFASRADRSNRFGRLLEKGFEHGERNV